EIDVRAVAQPWMMAKLATAIDDCRALDIAAKDNPGRHAGQGKAESHLPLTRLGAKALVELVDGLQIDLRHFMPKSGRHNTRVSGDAELLVPVDDSKLGGKTRCTERGIAAEGGDGAITVQVSNRHLSAFVLAKEDDAVGTHARSAGANGADGLRVLEIPCGLGPGVDKDEVVARASQLIERSARLDHASAPLNSSSTPDGAASRTEAARSSRSPLARWTVTSCSAPRYGR